MKLLLLGATGLVGGHVLQLALASGAVSDVVAPTRTPLAGAPRLINVVGPRLEDLLPAALAPAPDAVICALGTTIAKAGSQAAFRHIDYELPLLFGTAARAAGVPTYVLVTAMGPIRNRASSIREPRARWSRQFKPSPFPR